LFSIIDHSFYYPIVISSFEDFTVMCDPIQKCRGHFTIPEHLWPFVEMNPSNLANCYHVQYLLSTLFLPTDCREYREAPKWVNFRRRFTNGSPQSLNLSAKQKKNIQSLEVSLTENGQRVSGEYLSGQEVIMLDIAISKAIALLAPQVVYNEN